MALRGLRVSDSNQPSRAITLQKGSACRAALLPHQCRAQSEEARRDGSEDLSQDPKSRLQIAVTRVVIPAGSLAWPGLGAEQGGTFEQEINGNWAQKEPE